MTLHNAIFSSAELEFIHARAFTMRHRDIASEIKTHFNRTVTIEQIKSCCKYRGWFKYKKPAHRGMTHIHHGNLMVRVSTAKIYKKMQRLLLEEIVGPIPAGRCLVPINGDRFDFDPFNWMMLTNSMMNRLRQSPFFKASLELRPMIFGSVQLKATLVERGYGPAKNRKRDQRRHSRNTASR